MIKVTKLTENLNKKQKNLLYACHIVYFAA